MVDQDSDEQRAGLLRAWHLAILRFAVTHANADRLGVLAIANEIDRLGRPDKTTEGFRFFRKITAELCTAVLRQDADNDILLGSYLAQIGDARLHRALTAAFGIPQPNPAKKRVTPHQDLWRGLPSRAGSRP